MRSWILALVAAIGLAFGGNAAVRAEGASCPTCTQTAQAGDALSIFLAMLQGAPPGAFTYQEAKSLGPNAFEITNIVFAPDGPGSEMPIARLLVENIDIASLMQGGMPSALKLRLEGMGLNRANSDLDSDFWEMMGQDEILANLAIDLTTNAATQGFTLSDLTVDLPGIGQAQLKLDLLGAGPEALMAPEAAMFTATLKSASLMLNDQSFVGRSLDAAIKESGMTEAELMAMGLQELSNGLAEMGAVPGDRVFQAGAVLGGWLMDARSPKGPITITFAPAQPVNFQQLNQVAGAGQAAELLNLQVTYAGSVATLPEPQESSPEYYSYVFTDRDFYNVGDVVTVFWSGMPGNLQDYVTVVPYGSPSADPGQGTYTNGAMDGSYTVGGLGAGDYEVRVFYDYPAGGYEVQAYYYFTVGAPANGTSTSTIGTDKTTYAVGETVVVFWTGLPGNTQDWVTVVPAGAPAEEWGEWTYTNGQTTGAFPVNGLAAGDYEARVYHDYPNGGTTIHAVSTFTVTP
jgi:hypothetical protein